MTMGTENILAPFLDQKLSNACYTISNEQDNFLGLESDTQTPEEGVWPS